MEVGRGLRPVSCAWGCALQMGVLPVGLPPGGPGGCLLWGGARAGAAKAGEPPGTGVVPSEEHTVPTPSQGFIPQSSPYGDAPTWKTVTLQSLISISEREAAPHGRALGRVAERCQGRRAPCGQSQA